jgi:hypothetical protein
LKVAIHTISFGAVLYMISVQAMRVRSVIKIPPYFLDEGGTQNPVDLPITVGFSAMYESLWVPAILP